MAMESFIIKMEDYTQEYGNRIKCMVMVYYIMQMVNLLMMGNGIMINFMELELYLINNPSN